MEFSLYDIKLFSFVVTPVTLPGLYSQRCLMYDHEATDLVRRQGKINQHCTVVRVMSFCVVPDIVTVHTVCVAVYQHIAADTCMSSSRHKLIHVLHPASLYTAPKVN